MVDLQVERWPGRKRPVLLAVEGNVSTVLAIFTSDAAKDRFIELINDRLRKAGEIGRAHG